MLALHFSQKTALSLDDVPEQWRGNISQMGLLVVGQTVKTWAITVNVQPEDSSYRYRALMQRPQLVLKFNLPFYIEFPVGTYCTYQNQRFMLMRAQDLKKQGTRKIEYSMTLGTNEDYFAMWKLRNVVDAVEQGANAPKDNRLKFSLCAKPHEFISLIVRNLNKKDTSVTWSVGECLESSEKTVEFNHSTIDAALTDIANIFNTEYEVEWIGTTQAKIHLRRVEYFKDSPVALSYGVGNGFIPGVGRTSAADGVPVKRMFVQGSDRNIDRAKYGSPELKLPISQSIQFDGTHFEDEDGFDSTKARTYTSDAEGEYVERTDVVSQATKEDSVDCSEIYPSRVGEVTSVVVANADKNFYDFIDNTIPEELNFNNCLIAGETMTVIFQDGMLAGKEFDVKYKHAERKFQIVPQEIDGVTMPNATWCPKEEQTYAIFGIQLPDSYICNNTDKSGGSWDMMRAAVRALYECEDQKFTFTGSLQSLWSKKHWLEVGGKLIVGGHVLFQDAQFAVDGTVIRITGIKDFLTQPYSPTIELSNSVSGGSSVSTQIRQINNTEVVVEDTEKRLVQYTKRRFRDALETIGMLENANIGDFSGSLSPVAIHTMAMLVGDESLQFRFAYEVITQNEDGTQSVSYSPTTCIGYSQEKKQLYATMQSAGMNIRLQHMTLGQNAIMTKTRRENGTFVTWPMQSYVSPVLDDPKSSYYLYAKVSSTSTETAGEFVLSQTAIAMEAVQGYYHLLCGVLNSELEGQRSYVSLYGFTEILPGRITTDLLISNDGKTYFDLEKGEIGGAIKFLSDNGYITIIEGGKIKTELIDVSQIIARSVIVGEPDHQRVEIQPDSEGNGSVKIYDASNNEVTVLEGQSYTDIKQLYDGSTGADCEILTRTATVYGYASGVTLGRGKHTYNAGDSSSQSSKSFVLSKVWHTGTPTEVEIKHGNLQATAHSAGFTYTTSGGLGVDPIQNSHASALIYVHIETYANYDEATGTLSNRIDQKTICSASASASATAQTIYEDDSMNGQFGNNTGSSINKPITIIGGGSESHTVTYQSDTQTSGVLNFAGKKVRVPAGYHRLTISIYCSASYTGSYAAVLWGNTSGSASDIAAKWVSDFYVSRYFANGFCLGTRSDNYILAYKDGNNGMRFVMENNDLGFDFSKSGIRTRTRSSEWMPLPLLIFKGAYYYDGNEATETKRYKVQQSDGIRSFMKSNGSDVCPSTYRSGKGLVTLSFPDEWKTALSDIGVKNLLIQVNAKHKVIDARVYDITTTSFKVGMSDDASLNDGDFSVTIYYLPS